MTNTIVKKRYEINITIIKNIFMEKKPHRRKANVNIYDDSWRVVGVWRQSSKSGPVRMLANSYKEFSVVIRRTRNFLNFRLYRFLD